ncbi:MAG: two-component system regulatory protein YycI [Acetivibrionales bacterium]
MDISKAKIIIIVLLAAFNVFLLVNIFIISGGQDIHAKTIKNAELILNSRGITLECDIPGKTSGFRRLEYGNGEIDRKASAKKLLGKEYEISGEGEIFEHSGKKIVFKSGTKFEYTDEQPAPGMDIRSDDKAADAALKFLKDKGLLEGKYVADDIMRDADGSVTVHFVEKYDNMLLFDNYCTVTIGEKGVSRLVYSKYEVNGFTQSKVEEFEAYQALLGYFEGGGSRVITSIDSGYKLGGCPMEEIESIELLPVWRIKLKDEPDPVFISPNDLKYK